MKMCTLPETDDRDCRGRGGTVESSQRAVVIVLVKGKKVCLSGNGHDRRHRKKDHRIDGT